MIRICHLSDIHLNGNHLLDFKQFLLDALIRDLKLLHSEKQIDLFLLSGDLIDKGGEGFDGDTTRALRSFETTFIDPITSALALPKSRVIIAPGNHDIDRKADENIEEVGLQHTLLTPESVNAQIDSGKENGIRRVLPFKSFEKSFYHDFPAEYDLTLYQSTFKMTLNNHTFGICALNSAWRCYDSDTDKGRLLLGERQIANAKAFIADADARIAIIHHPLDWMALFDARVVNSMIEREYDLLFCGHVHEGSTWTRTNMYGNLFVSISPCNWTYNLRSTDRHHSNGYTIVDYDVDKSQVVTHCRRYNHDKNSFDPNTDLGDDHGKNVFYLPDADTQRSRSREVNIVQTIQNIHIPELNEHLLTYYTDTKAPKELDKLFVEPTIVSRSAFKSDDPESETETIYTITQLCERDENFVIFGTKESGKTTLLDRLIVTFSTSISKYHKIPIYIDFAEIGNRRFETIISSYLNIGITAIDNILSNHSIVLLIDNMSFSHDTLHKIKRLETVLSAYTNIRVIATSLQTIEGEIPADFLEYSTRLSFKAAYFKGFMTKQIRELINKWFYTSDIFDTPSKLDSIVQVLLTLNLPRTPLSISMFLWIIEKQENYRPVNHATMLENFIERLFKKWSKTEIYREEFDYRNKERLLAEIAYVMYTTGDVNYRLSYVKLLDFTTQYMKSRKFEFDSVTVLDDFLIKGIFVSDFSDSEKYIRFRFTCFLQYFLMKKMESDQQFKQFVLQENNFLHFTNEIDYYTGLKRDQVDILKLLIQRMNTAYEQICNDILKLKYSYDTVFESKANMACTLDEGFVKALSHKKPNDDDIDRITDEMLERVRVDKNIQKKDLNISPMLRLERMWTLAAQVFKNTEETNEVNLKESAYHSIIRCSMAYACCYKCYLEDYLSKYGDKIITIDKDIYEFLRTALPLAHQVVLHHIMGTRKLNIVIRDKIRHDVKADDLTDFEKFISIFLYADMRGENYMRHIAKFIRGIKRSYMYDMTLFKLVTYYFLRSKDKNTDKVFENLIGDLIIKSKRLPKNRKGKVIDDYRMKRKRHPKDDGIIDI